MKAMKRLVAVAAVFLGLGAGTAFANYPVIDVANLTEAIEQVYQTYMDIQQAIQSVQNQYVMIKRSIEACKNINWQKFADLASPETWENPETMRNAYKAALSQYNSNMNRIKNVRNKVNAKHVRIGNMKVSYADLFGISKDGYNDSDARFNASKSAIDILRERRKKIADAYTGQLTPEERNKIMKEYGVSAENYAETQVAEAMVENYISDVVQEAKEFRNQDREAQKAAADGSTKDIQENAPDSTTARLDLSNTLLAQLVHAISTTEERINDLPNDMDAQDKANKREARLRQRQQENAELQDKRKAIKASNYGSPVW